MENLIENIKYIIAMIYDITETVDIYNNNKTRGFIKLYNKDILKQILYVNLETSDYIETPYKEIKKLPDGRILALEEHIKDEICNIQILNNDTFNVEESHPVKLNSTYCSMGNTDVDTDCIPYNVYEAPFVHIKTPFSVTVYNIHGDDISKLYSCNRIYKNKFINKQTELIEVDNLIDARIVSINKLETYQGRLDYYAISGKLNRDITYENESSVLFLHFIPTGNIYAYKYRTGKIYRVQDSRASISIKEFDEIAKGCMDTPDEERETAYRDTLSKFNGDTNLQKLYEKKQYDFAIISLTNRASNYLNLHPCGLDKHMRICFNSIQGGISNHSVIEDDTEKIVSSPLHDVKQIIWEFKYTEGFVINNFSEAEIIAANTRTPFSLKLKNQLDRVKTDLGYTETGLIVTSNEISVDEMLKIEGVDGYLDDWWLNRDRSIA